MSSRRVSISVSLTESLKKFQLSTSRQTSTFSHPLYTLAGPQSVSIDDFDPVSRFSSCSTSATSSYDSLALSDLASCSSATTPGVRSRATSTGSSSSTASARPKYADHHYPLIETVKSSKECGRTLISMAHAHNTLIRAINSCYNHAQLVFGNQIADYLLFSQTLFDVISHLLKTEQEVILPLFHEPTSHARSSRQGQTLSIFRNPAFFSVFHAWASYIHDPATQETFSSEHAEFLVSQFAPLLTQYLHDTVSSLGDLTDEGSLHPRHLSQIWAKINQVMVDTLDPETDIVLLLGCQDKHFKINNKAASEEFPVLPLTMSTKIKRWYSRQHKGTWALCPSDFCGKRRLLHT